MSKLKVHALSAEAELAYWVRKAERERTRGTVAPATLAGLVEARKAAIDYRARLAMWTTERSDGVAS